MYKTTFITSLILFVICSGPIHAQETTDYLVQWAPSPEPDVVEYIIYRSLDLTPGEAIDSIPVSETSYIDTDLEKGVKYYYRVVAKNSAGERSGYSNPVSGMTIAQDADPSMHELCRIDDVIDGGGTFEIDWSTAGSTIGFVQYGESSGSLDSISNWDENYASTHTSTIDNLIMPNTYYVRAVSYDNSKNMIVSAVDTITSSGEEPNPPTAPLLSIYPVPYHPDMGTMFMDNLPPGGSVTVYNENGLEVWQHDVGTETSIKWDGTNAYGSPVMSGVYYVLVRDADGNVVDRRPVMIVH